MDPSTEHLIAAIGPRLRAMRTARGLTLEAVAHDSGLSVSALSRLETGKRAPSLDALLPLAKTYRVSLDQIVGAPATGDPRVHLQPQAMQSGGVVVPLTSNPSRVHVFKHVIEPREPKLTTHQGRAWIYVLAGQLRLLLGDEEHLIGPGETAQFDSATPHWFGPADDHAVEILHLFGPHGDRPLTRLGDAGA
ncbi:helix-turn-helix domain-containing protein [Leucobacter sp. UCMA 4100]|uniref:helix-turn-helix domain-containing protein n=1 Tax=Leucobacter sp. UCMA 4100 TaxID=2810534 RepID=UPI0022EAF468|nr:helix-turn-helix transcriptional regulator [Leucobacter sp. UCMA 4100]MDA3146993.1 helix-turn-helix domain-containing protein [Leucobacter sp. UCMA 4100]